MNYPATLYVKRMPSPEAQDGFWFTADFPTPDSVEYILKGNNPMTKFGNQLQQYAQGAAECLHPINQIEDRPDGSVFCRSCNTQVRESKAPKPVEADKDATIAAQQAEIATQASHIKGLEVFARRITRTDLSPERFVEWAQDYAESVLNS